jgi:hypothetical protein
MAVNQADDEAAQNKRKSTLACPNAKTLPLGA